MNIFIYKDKRCDGPFTPKQAGEFIRQGRYSLSDLAWHEGLFEWKPIHSMPGVVDLVLPPLPVNPKKQTDSITASPNTIQQSPNKSLATVVPGIIPKVPNVFNASEHEVWPSNTSHVDIACEPSNKSNASDSATHYFIHKPTRIVWAWGILCVIGLIVFWRQIFSYDWRYYSLLIIIGAFVFVVLTVVMLEICGGADALFGSTTPNERLDPQSSVVNQGGIRIRIANIVIGSICILIGILACVFGWNYIFTGKVKMEKIVLVLGVLGAFNAGIRLFKSSK